MSQQGGWQGDLPRWLDGQFSRAQQARVARRGVVMSGGLLLTGAAVASAPGGRQVVDALLTLDSQPMAAPEARLSTGVVVERLRRAEDQLSLDVVLFEMKVVKPTRGLPYLTPIKGRTAYLWVVLPGQNIGEQVKYAEPFSPNLAEIAFPSVLVFKVPPGVELEYSIAGLLRWTSLKPVWSAEQGQLTSVIEAPYRLLLQPHSSLVWQHDRRATALPSSSGPAHELWHSRLTARDASMHVDPRSDLHRTVTVPARYSTPLETSLTPLARKQLVKYAGTPSEPDFAPVEVNHLMLSSIGASLDLHGVWEDPASLAEWDHRATWGRDQYVKVVQRGFLAPFGHKAVVITEVVRKIADDAYGAVAYLSSTQTLLITQPSADTSVWFDRHKGSVVHGCAFPFAEVQTKVRLTPPVSKKYGGSLENGGDVYLDGTGTPLVLPFTGIDWDGREATFTAPVTFVSYDKQVTPSRTWTLDLGGQQVAVSKAPDDNPGVTTAPLHTVTVVDQPLSTFVLNGARALFRPVAKDLTLTVPAAAALAGTGPVQHAYHPKFVKDQGNPGGVVLGASTPASVEVDAQFTGGLAQLPAAYQGLSTKAGAVFASGKEALNDLADAASDPAKIFDAVQLLGCISLTDIVAAIDADVTKAEKVVANLPNALTELVGQRQTMTLTLKPKLQAWPSDAKGPIVFLPGTLALTSKAATGGGQPAEYSLDVRLTDAKLQLADLVVLPIVELRVSSSSAAPFDLSLTLGKVQFLGPLAFVQTLAEIIAPLLSSGSGSSRTAPRATPKALSAPGGEAIPVPDVDVTADGIVVTEAISLPAVQLGAFSLTGLGFGLELTLGFTGSLRTRVNFATHVDPFQVTYLAVGGGGYVALELYQGEVSQLEVSLQVAGALGFDVGVASGGLQIAAGFILVLPASGGLTVTAFLRATGSLDVLGLVHISVVFELTLAYQDGDPSTLTGTATLELKVEVLFFSKTVSVTMSKTLAGGHSGTPVSGSARAALGSTDTALTFTDAYPTASTWSTYADAFFAPVS